jgi:hypothetical protein
VSIKLPLQRLPQEHSRNELVLRKHLPTGFYHTLIIEGKVGDDFIYLQSKPNYNLPESQTIRGYAQMTPLVVSANHN